MGEYVSSVVIREAEGGSELVTVYFEDSSVGCNLYHVIFAICCTLGVLRGLPLHASPPCPAPLGEVYVGGTGSAEAAGVLGVVKSFA